MCELTLTDDDDEWKSETLISKSHQDLFFKKHIKAVQYNIVKWAFYVFLFGNPAYDQSVDRGNKTEEEEEEEDAFWSVVMFSIFNPWTSVYC